MTTAEREANRETNAAWDRDNRNRCTDSNPAAAAAGRRHKRAGGHSIRKPGDIKEEALNRFIGVVSEVRALLDSISSAADEHFDTTPEEIHWGNVGDACRTRDGLQEILGIIRGEVQ